MLMCGTLLHDPHLHQLKSPAESNEVPIYPRSMEDLLQEVQNLFEQQLRIESLLSLSKKLQIELKECLVSSPHCMLPSHNYTLPSGEEKGTYLALEVGGSTLRVATVELSGRSTGTECLRVRRMECSPIDSHVRQLQGLSFFDWIAERIAEMLVMDKEAYEHMLNVEPLHMGIAWAFPIDQTSIRSGNVLGMGKNFICSSAVKGHDLGEIITQACQRANLNIRLDAIINDSSAALLSRAYVDPSTRLAVIFGTGLNAAIHLPITSLNKSKLGSRILPENGETTHVLVNTELSMFGKSIFSTTRWDDLLNRNHILPDYQPLEYLISGGYMGEIVRLILIEATESAGLFGGELPPSLRTPYVLDTRTLAAIELDTSPSLTHSRYLLQDRHPSANLPTYFDLDFIRRTIQSVSCRSSAYFTAGVHALSSLLNDLESHDSLQNQLDLLDHVSIGCDGSVINKYPGFMATSQEIIDKLVEMDTNGMKRVVLEKTVDSAVLGAGVAVAMAAMTAATHEHRLLSAAEAPWPSLKPTESGWRWLRHLLEPWWSGLQRRVRSAWTAIWRVKTD